MVKMISRIVVIRVALLVLTTLMLIASRLPSRAAMTNTPACGVINTNTTWLLINSPYIVCTGGITISPSAALTIEPGVTVQFENAGTNRLYVSGELNAIGTSTQPITFTGLVTTPGSWGGLAANNTAIAPAVVSLSYVTLEYGGVNGSYGAQLYADQAVVTVTHSLIRNGDSHGVYIAYNNPQTNISKRVSSTIRATPFNLTSPRTISS